MNVSKVEVLRKARRTSRGTSYDRLGDLREHAESRRTRESVMILVSLAGVAALVGLLAKALSD